MLCVVGIREVPERVSERIEKVPGRYVDNTVKASRVACVRRFVSVYQ